MKRTILIAVAALVFGVCVVATSRAVDGDSKVWHLADGTAIADTSRFIPPQPLKVPPSEFKLPGKGRTEVVVHVIVGLGGQPAATDVRGGSSPEEIAAAVAAAERAVFTPAKLNGSPVAVRYELRYRHTAE